MSTVDLSGVHSKLGWAKRHFEAVDLEISAWLKDQPESVFHDHNEDFTEHYARVRFAGEMPDFVRWSLMIGDCVTNLRDTLDHLVFAIAHDPSSPCPEKRDAAAFVITRPGENFNASRHRVASVPDRIKDSIISFQPDNRPHAKFPPLLAVLKELANGSKHKLLSVVFATTEQGKIRFRSLGGPPHPTRCTYGVTEDSIENNSTLVVLTLAESDPNVQLVSADIRFGVAIKHTPKLGDTSFDAGSGLYKPLIQLLFQEVECVISTISRLL